MALIFQRLARNFIKNGYFPTDEKTIERVLAMLEPMEGSIRIIDPCCGEGIALAECANYLRNSGSTVFSAGIEFDRERASHATSLLDHVVHADMNDCVVGQGQFNMLWLNPPYGDRITDQFYRESDQQEGRDRLEKYFLRRSLPMLAFGGLLIYIIPHYVLDKHLAKQLVRSLDNISCYRLPEDQFKQIVIMGYRRRVENVKSSELIDQLLEIASDRSAAPELPEIPERFYSVMPATQSILNKPLDVRSVRPTAEQIAEVASKHPCLWMDFSNHFKQRIVIKRRPARDLSSWHLALMLAAGQVSGVVTSPSGRQLLVKGGTHKEKEVATEFSESDSGEMTETRILTDRFVPIIKAIDVQKDSPTFGDVFTVR